MYRIKFFRPALLMVFILLFIAESNAQKKKKSKNEVPGVQYEESLYEGLEYRLVGPFRGGRSAAVTGVPGEPNLFYFGSTGG